MPAGVQQELPSGAEAYMAGVECLGGLDILRRDIIQRDDARRLLVAWRSLAAGRGLDPLDAGLDVCDQRGQVAADRSARRRGSLLSDT